MSYPKTAPPPTPRVQSWMLFQYAQSLSPRTVDERAATIMRCATELRTDPEALRVDQLASWLANDDWTPSTRWTYHRSLCSWFQWLQVHEYRLDNPMLKLGKMRRPKSIPRPITDRQLQRLLGTRVHCRTRAMVLLAAFQGLRTFEIAKLKGEDLDLVGRTLRVAGKGGVTAVLPLHHRVAAHASRMPEKGFWFPGEDRGHQRRESISSTIGEAMKRAEVPGSAHQLRHWFGTALMRAGVDLRTVQTLLRHQHLNSTEIYTMVADEGRAAAIDLLDPYKVRQLAERVEDLPLELTG